MKLSDKPVGHKYLLVIKPNAAMSAMSAANVLQGGLLCARILLVFMVNKDMYATYVDELTSTPIN